jgi:hypothetical protein
MSPAFKRICNRPCRLILATFLAITRIVGPSTFGSWAEIDKFAPLTFAHQRI